MMDAKSVRNAIQAFRERTGNSGSLEHCFAPWYLHHQYKLAESAALEQSSDGSYDFGIDGFYLAGGERPSELVLVQCKLSESITTIGAGFRDFEKSLPQLQSLLERFESDVPIENKVLVSLRAALNRLSDEVRERLQIEFHLVHASIEDADVFAQKTREKRTRLREAIEKALPERAVTIREIGPAHLGHRPAEIIAPPRHYAMKVMAGGIVDGSDSRMLLGIGRLADLVEMYKTRRDHLFSRNVRYFLRSKRNVEKGPAARMRETLKRMCVEKKSAPDLFALFHNGITIHAARFRLDGEDASVFDPYVLNGCQTVKNAFLFRHDPNLRSRIDEELWSKVSVPVRIIETRDEDLVRSITVNNNRQNAIAFAALRANDPVQIRLEERFREVGVFYERQEGAFENLEASSPEKFEEEYENTRGRAVEMVDLARVVAAVAGEIGLAERPNELFESDAAYKRCFDERKRSRSVTFLVFLQNLSDVASVILKKDLNLTQRGGGPKPSRLRYYTICLLTRYLARERQHDLVLEYGKSLVGRDRGFREEIAGILKSRKSGIREELNRQFIRLEAADGSSMANAFAAAQRALRLKDNIDPFDVFADLDAEDATAVA